MQKVDVALSESFCERLHHPQNHTKSKRRLSQIFFQWVHRPQYHTKSRRRTLLGNFLPKGMPPTKSQKKQETYPCQRFSPIGYTTHEVIQKVEDINLSEIFPKRVHWHRSFTTKVGDIPLAEIVFERVNHPQNQVKSSRHTTFGNFP